MQYPCFLFEKLLCLFVVQSSLIVTFAETIDRINCQSLTLIKLENDEIFHIIDQIKVNVKFLINVLNENINFL